MAPKVLHSAKSPHSFGQPGPIMDARNLVGGDLCAALLWYRLRWRWNNVPDKLDRFGYKWLAMSREAWAREAGLSIAEMKNRALPKLRKLPFVEIRQMRLGPDYPKVLWMRVIEEEIEDQYVPYDMFEGTLGNIKSVGHSPDPAYSYGKGDLDE